MRTSIVRSISDHDENNKVGYTLEIEKGSNPSVRLSVTGAVNDDNIKTMDMHAIAKGYDDICCLHDVLEMILKDLERETNWYKEEEIRF